VDEAYDALGATYKLYLDRFNRNSLDDSGLPLDATVHYGQDYNNAFWTGGSQDLMVFGDGDSELFNRFTIALDVIGHELTHGVTEFESGLDYSGQSGALNEHLSDVFGSLVKQYQLNQSAAEADWLIGAGLFTNAVQSGQPGVPAALRSMKAPGTGYDDPELGRDPQPAHMDDYVTTSDDNGGVHINSGIPNHAFYLAATRLGGSAWEKAGRIWYETMTDPSMRRLENFNSFARKIVQTTTAAFGPGSQETEIVRASWQEVGIFVRARSARQRCVRSQSWRRLRSPGL